jgi:hypothetical protein
MDCIIASHLIHEERAGWLQKAISSALPHCERVIVSVSGQENLLNIKDEDGRVVLLFQEERLQQFGHIRKCVGFVESPNVLFLDVDDLLLPNTLQELSPHFGHNTVGHQYGFRPEKPTLLTKSNKKLAVYSPSGLEDLLPQDISDRGRLEEALQWVFPWHSQLEYLQMMLTNYNNERFLKVYNSLSPEVILFALWNDVGKVKAHIKVGTDFSGTLCPLEYLTGYLDEIPEEEGFQDQEDIDFMGPMRLLTTTPYVYRRYHGLPRDYR